MCSNYSKPRRNGSATCFRARACSARTASIGCSSACNSCSRNSRKACGRNARSSACYRRNSACSGKRKDCNNVIWRASRSWEYSLRLDAPPLLPRCKLPHGGDLQRASPVHSLREHGRLGTTAGLPATPGGTACARRLCRGPAAYSGPMPIPTFSSIRSGPTGTSPAIGLTLTMTSSIPCSGVRKARIPPMPDSARLNIRRATAPPPALDRANAQA